MFAFHDSIQILDVFLSWEATITSVLASILNNPYYNGRSPGASLSGAVNEAPRRCSVGCLCKLVLQKLKQFNISVGIYSNFSTGEAPHPQAIIKQHRGLITAC